MNEKQFYTSPEVDVLVVRFEANIMSPVPGQAGANDPYHDYGSDF
jgi:hypothetical protein